MLIEFRQLCYGSTFFVQCGLFVYHNTVLSFSKLNRFVLSCLCSPQLPSALQSSCRLSLSCPNLQKCTKLLNNQIHLTYIRTLSFKGIANSACFILFVFLSNVHRIILSAFEEGPMSYYSTWNTNLLHLILASIRFILSFGCYKAMRIPVLIVDGFESIFVLHD